MIKKMNKYDYYLGIAKAVAIKSNCLCVAHGALIVKDDQIISTGYVGAPRKTKDCTELGFCIRRKKNVKSGTGYEICRSVHSEMNAIINAARAGVSLLNGDMYMYGQKRLENGELTPIDAYPCLMCKKMIVNAGIKRFISNDKDGNIKEYNVQDWVDRWRDMEDISQDSEKYEVDYNEK